jgi:beta-phosphoglucomutase-like phosphatase (HAD superfamily)
MDDYRRNQALAAWRKLLEEPGIRMDAEEQYEELLKMADDFKLQGIIDADDWRELIEEAGAFYAHTIEGVGGGT